ncbi:MAG: DUF4065 domain-containing protein [Acidobacteriaceae bacterium]|nr:DUF4065 domain-containing protein [Acidobacteriaceae bacterium]
MDPGVVSNLMTAIVTWVTDHDSWVTKTKLLKLLYLFDVEYYRRNGRTFTEFKWKFFHLGPWASEYDPALTGLLAHEILSEQRSNDSEYDTAFYRPLERLETRCAFQNVRDESILLEVLNRWGRRTTGEILNYVYFQTEPMEMGIRNEPLEFSTIRRERPPAYSRASSGKSASDIRNLRAKFARQQLAKKVAKQDPPFTFTPPNYDDEYFEAMAHLDGA